LKKKLVRVLTKETVWPPPIWLMRQAGRYLPEYRALRAKAGSFWTLSNTPELAAEITLQPIRRFGFDGAVIFSDILTVPVAMGVPVAIVENEGPRLAPISDASALTGDEASWAKALAPAYETIQRVKAELSPETTLIGFAGAPWTLATYLAAGRGRDEQKAAKLWGYRDPEGFDALLDRLADCIAQHLIQQIDAGADVVQLFDSWAQGLPAPQYERWVIRPAVKIVSKIRAAHPPAKIIGFPRGSTLDGYELFAGATDVNGMSVDTAAPVNWMAEQVCAIQGNLDPIALVNGGKALDESVDNITDAMRGRPFIFNLGHGILQETPIAHVEQLVARVRSAG
jgi:uroporphyrinogen decarboxylase